ncbi:MAG TPA: excalibur calcium-binding domain-containing protein [Steroidobacteraceae bacterium]|jgi:hypothetical protein|nr:excalibur calcium-binding domain-containing protein [Steroidobacteraceae bacterium]
MKRVLVGVIIGALALFAWQRTRPHETPVEREAAREEQTEIKFVTRAPAAAPAAEPEAARFSCDGRVYCSQMTSCEEATWFLRNCPGVKMDGDNDGDPCEQQWCR